MLKEAIEIKDLVAKAHEAIFKLVIQLEKNPAMIKDMNEAVDSAFTIRECTALLESLIKHLRNRQAIYEKTAVGLWQINPEVTDVIRTDVCTASPAIKRQVTIPSRHNDPDNLIEFCNHLGVPADLALEGIVNFHWPRLCEFLSRDLEPGVKPDKIPGVKGDTITYYLTMRRRNQQK